MTGNKRPPPEVTSTVQLPVLDEDEAAVSERLSTKLQAVEPEASAPDSGLRPFLIVLRGRNIGELYALDQGTLTIGRAHEANIHIDDHSVSRIHAKVLVEGQNFVIEDQRSANGTYVNGHRVDRAIIRNGDHINIGPNQLFKLEYQDAVEESAKRQLFLAASSRDIKVRVPRAPWSPDSWLARPAAQMVAYEDEAALGAVVDKLKRLPPLVASWEVEDLKRLIAEAQEGKRFLLQGGDCAETLHECNPTIITNKLKILLQMSLVLMHALRVPVIRVGRFAGQYAKPRSRPTEVRNGVELPSYVGDLVNRPEFTREARRADPNLLLAGYQHAAMTLNFIRAMSGGGFTDLKRPEYYDLSFFGRAELPAGVRREHQRMSRQIAEALYFVTAVGQDSVQELARAFFTSHEGLNLIYESAQTRQVPRREGYYDLTTHFPWIGERTRALSGAHVEFFRGIMNPIGVKIGPTAPPADVVELCKMLNPDNEPGKLVLIARMGAAKVGTVLPSLIQAIQRAGQRVLWVSDPMHGNMVLTKSGLKTRNFDDILAEVSVSMDVHASCGSYFGGIHFELTGDEVTECIGGSISEEDLDRAYLTACDPRLNYLQALEMAFCIARRMRPSPSVPPPP